MEPINDSERNIADWYRSAVMSWNATQTGLSQQVQLDQNAWVAAQPRIQRLDPRPIITGTAGEIPNANLELRFFNSNWDTSSSYNTWIDLDTEEKIQKKQKEEYNIFNKLTITK